MVDLNAKPSDIENKLTVSSVARRRLAVVVTKLKMAETVSDVGDPIPTQAYSVSLPLGGRSAVNEETELIIQAVRTIEQGHIRVGPSPVTDPAMLVTRQLEDFVTWVDTSARKRTIMKYNDEVSYGVPQLFRRDETDMVVGRLRIDVIAHFRFHFTFSIIIVSSPAYIYIRINATSCCLPRLEWYTEGQIYVLTILTG
jgi:ribosomal protein S4